jgi:hypothetical protein
VATSVSPISEPSGYVLLCYSAMVCPYGFPVVGMAILGHVRVFIHLLDIVEFQSLIQVFIQRAIQDLTFRRGARLIAAAASEFNFNSTRRVPSLRRNRLAATQWYCRRS